MRKNIDKYCVITVTGYKALRDKFQRLLVAWTEPHTSRYWGKNLHFYSRRNKYCLVIIGTSCLLRKLLSGRLFFSWFSSFLGCLWLSVKNLTKIPRTRLWNYQRRKCVLLQKAFAETCSQLYLKGQRTGGYSIHFLFNSMVNRKRYLAELLFNATGLRTLL